jgi:hypothetical protein
MAGEFDATKCAKWLERGLLNPGPRATSVVLGYRPASAEGGGRPRPQGVDSWPFPEDQVAVDVNDLVNKINEAAQDFADGSGEGLHSFLVEMYHGDAGGSGTPWSTVYAFIKTGGANDANAGSGTEMTADGGVKYTGPVGKTEFAIQQMRHNEHLHNRLMHTNEFIIRHFGGQVNALQHQVVQLQTRYWEAIATHETMLDGRQERELRNLEAANKMSRWNRLWEVLYTVLPIIGAKIINKPELLMALPKQVTEGGPVMRLIEQIIGGLEEDQIQAILMSGALKPEQIQAFVELHGIIAESAAKKAEQEAINRKIATTSKDDIPKRDNQVAAGGGNIMEGLAGFVSPGRQINK